MSFVYAGENESLRGLSLAMIAIGVSFVVVLPFAPAVWPAGFRWFHPAHHVADEHMILAMYVALGVCLVAAARDPLRHSMILDYTILSSVLHGLVMLYYALVQQGEIWHLVGDVPLLFALAAGLAVYHPKRLARGAAGTRRTP